MRSLHAVGWGGGEGGAASLVAALAMPVLLAAAAIAVDLGHMMNVRTESQRVADAAALAGASAFVFGPQINQSATARAWATQTAALNTVDQVSVTLLSTDIDVNAAIARVDVTVRHNQSRGNPISTIFGRVFGIPTVDVVTTAAAQASPASGVHCVLPLFLVDQWDERGGNPLQYDPGTDYYEPFVPSAPTSTYTGYDTADIGRSIILKPAQGPPSQSGRPNPSWYYPFDANNIPGGANYRASIQGCTSPDFVYTMGMNLWIEPGAMIGPTKKGFKSLINQDPTATWDPVLKCVVDASNLGSGNGAYCRSSVRSRPVPMYDPGTAPGNGKKQVTVTNFAGVFVDRVQGNNIWVIFTGYSGVLPAGGPPAPGGSPPILQLLRLVQ